MKPVLLVGQAPSRVMQPGDRPFQGTKALNRLALYCGEPDPEQLYEMFEFVNLVDEYPGPATPGSKWDQKPVVPSDRLAWIHKQIMCHYRTVLLGAAARDVILGHQRLPMFQWSVISNSPHVECTWSAHPGGTSMYWNQPKNRAAGEAFWREFYGQLVRMSSPTSPISNLWHSEESGPVRNVD